MEWHPPHRFVYDCFLSVGFGSVLQAGPEVVPELFSLLGKGAIIGAGIAAAFGGRGVFLGGIAFLQMDDFKNIKWLAPICFVLSIVILVTGIIKYILMKRRLKEFYSSSHPQ